MNRNVALSALAIVVAVSACSGDGGSLTPIAPAVVTQSQAGERAPASYGGIPDIIRITPVTIATACPTATPSPAPSTTAVPDSRKPKSYGGIPDMLVGVGVTVGVTVGCGP